MLLRLHGLVRLQHYTQYDCSRPADAIMFKQVNAFANGLTT